MSNRTLHVYIEPDGIISEPLNLHYVKDNHKIYHCAQHLFIELNTRQRVFFDYLCEHMDVNNGIRIDGSLIQDFIGFIKKISEAAYKAGTLGNDTRQLVDIGLLLKGEDRSAYYIINPKYCFKGPETDRVQLFKYLITRRLSEGLPINALVNTPVSPKDNSHEAH